MKGQLPWFLNGALTTIAITGLVSPPVFHLMRPAFASFAHLPGRSAKVDFEKMKNKYLLNCFLAILRTLLAQMYLYSSCRLWAESWNVLLPCTIECENSGKEIFTTIALSDKWNSFTVTVYLPFGFYILSTFIRRQILILNDYHKCYRLFNKSYFLFLFLRNRLGNFLDLPSALLPWALHFVPRFCNRCFIIHTPYVWVQFLSLSLYYFIYFFNSNSVMPDHSGRAVKR